MKIFSNSNIAIPQFQQRCLLVLLLLVPAMCFAQTKADLTINKRAGCMPLSGVNFTDASTGGTVVSWDWDLGNGNHGTNSTAGANYATDGVYYITLTVKFSNGDVRVKNDSIVVYPLPVADFTANDTAGCPPHDVQFKSLATTKTGTVTKWVWDFGPGGDSIKNPSFQYKAYGDYNVYLIVKNSWGCQSKNAASKLKYIHVYPPANASFNVPNNVSCDVPFTANFVNTSTGGGVINYVWNFGDGKSSTVANPSHNYTADGMYTVSLTAENGTNCSSTVSTSYDRSIFVGKPKPSVIAPDTVCATSNTLFQGNVTPPAFLYLVQWQFPDDGSVQYGQNTYHVFNTKGRYNVLMIASNYAGCSDTAKHIIVVKNAPVANFTVDKTISCDTPFTVHFTNTSTPVSTVSYDWDFGDGSPHETVRNPAHIYTVPGYYTVTLSLNDTTAGGGCSSVMQKPGLIQIAIPYVDLYYSPLSGCKPLPVQATAQVSNLIDPVATYIWDFGDGPRVTTASGTATHTYDSAGNYGIKLVIVTQMGCTDSSVVKPVQVDSCTGGGGGGGGGGDGGGGGFLGGAVDCNDKFSRTFTDTVSNAVILSWNFGDGSPLLTTPPLNPVTHTFPALAKYTVTLMRKDTITGRLDTVKQAYDIINPVPKFSPDFTNICINKTVNFATKGFDSGQVRSYTWNFGDGTSSTIDNSTYYYYYHVYLNGNTSHTYTDTGVYPVTLSLQDTFGCSNTYQFPSSIVVKGPYAGFKGQPLTSCNKTFNVTFTDTSIQNGSTHLSEWTWNFGDGSPDLVTDRDSVVHHRYANTAYYQAFNVSLKIKDKAGCTGSAIQYSYVKAYNPTAGFYSNDTLKCGDLSVFLYNNSAAQNATSTWYYGDRSSSVGYYGQHTYTKDGLYDIKLVVTDENGCIDSAIKKSYIKLIKPNAAFGASDTDLCAPVAIKFSDSSTYAKTFAWDFGDGGTGSTDENPPAKIYTTPGYYRVKLSISGVGGCLDSIKNIIHIKGPIATLSQSISGGCSPDTLTMRVTGSNISTYAWDYGDGTNVDPVANMPVVTHIYSVVRPYNPNVILVSPEGCPYALTADSVFVDTAKAGFTIDNRMLCDTGFVIFANNSSTTYFSSFVKYKWQFGDGTISTVETPPPHHYALPGSYDVSLAVQTDHGCTDTVLIKTGVTISRKPTVAILGDTTICLVPASLLNYTSNITAADPVSGYQWQVDALTVGTGANLATNYRVPGAHVLSLAVTTSKNCMATATMPVVIDSVKAAFSMGQNVFCDSGLVQFHNLSAFALPVQQYKWDFGDRSGSTQDSPSHIYNNPGSYDVRLVIQSTAGCADTALLKTAVTINKSPVAAIVGDTAVCLVPSLALNYASNITSVDTVARYQWKIDAINESTSPNMAVNYRVPGAHTVKLNITTTKNCKASVAIPLVIDSVAAAFSLGPNQFCDSGLVQFHNASTFAYPVQQYAWTFGDNNNSGADSPAHAYNKVGVYDVKLFVQTATGCKDSMLMRTAVTVSKSPAATISGDPLVCLVPSTMLNYKGNISSLDSITQYKWKIDATAQGSGANLLVNYRTPGAHNISLDITSAKNCKASSIMPILIDSVKAGFSFGNNVFCDTGTVQFNNLSTLAAPLLQYTWRFGDNNSSAATSPVHTYSAAGLYNVTLLVQSSSGCRDSTAVLNAVTVNQSPSATLSGDTAICLVPSTILNFTSRVVSADTVAAYQWKIDGAGVGTNPGLTINYRTPGAHTLGFIVTTTKNCVAVVNMPLVVDSVHAGFSAGNNVFCDTGTVQFSNLSTFAYPVQQYIWRFGDGQSSTQSNPPHTYLNPGTYGVSLFVQTATGCKDSLLVNPQVTVNKSPAASITGDTSVCLVPSTILNYASNTTSADTITRYQWKIDAAVAGTDASLVTNYRVAGAHRVTFVVTTAKNCKAIVTLPLVIDSISTAFAVDRKLFCDTGTAQFNNLSTFAYPIQQYIWKFGDNIASNDASPAHFYASPGTYNVSLYAQTLNGCADSVAIPQLVKLFTPPVVSYNGITEACANPAVNFYQASVTSQDSVTQYAWLLNNIVIGDKDTITHSFDQAGSYGFAFRVNTQYGCVETVAKTITIHALPIPAASPDTVICSGSVVQLHANDGDTFAWLPVNHIQFANTANPVASPIQDIKYYVTVTNQFGCIKNDSVAIKVDEKVGLQKSGDVAICAGSITNLSASGKATGFKWMPATGLSDSSIANPVASPAQTITYTIIGYSGNACKNDTGYVTVSVGNLPTVNAGKDTTLVAGMPYRLNPVVSDNVSRYVWKPSAGLDCATCATPLLIADKDITYTLTVTTPYNCSASDTLHLIVLCGKGAVNIPSAFSPNGDNHNDVFMVMGYGVRAVKRFQVFDRWGKPVFSRFNISANDRSNGWNGMVNNQYPAGGTTFVYLVDLECNEGREIHLKGTVVLIR